MRRSPLLLLILLLALAGAAAAADLPTLKREYEARFARFLELLKGTPAPEALEEAARALEAARLAYVEAGGEVPAGSLDDFLGGARNAPRNPKTPPPAAVKAAPAASAPARGSAAPTVLARAGKRVTDTWLSVKQTVSERAGAFGTAAWEFITGGGNPFAESFDAKKIPAAPPAPAELPAGFTAGVNLPWLPGGYGWDLGRHDAWGTRWNEAALDASFARFAALGLPVVRWFLYCDGRANPKWDEKTGRFKPPTAEFLAHLDRAVALARKHRVRIVWSFVDFHWFQKGKAANFERFSPIATDPALRADFIAKAILPVVERYADDPAIHAWEIINEPEWVTRDLNYPGAPGIFTVDSLRAFVRECAMAIKSASEKPVTVGSAHPKWMRHYVGTGIDLYQCHYYDKGAKVSKAALSARAFKREHGVDAPVVLGEFASRGSRYTPAQWLRIAAEAGYDGAWIWGYHSEDDSTSKQAIDALKK